MIKLKNLLLENYLLEASLPPGIDASNFIDWYEFTDKSSSIEEYRKGSGNVETADMDTIYKYKLARFKDPSLPIDPSIPYVHSYYLINKDGTTKDSDILRKEITQRPTQLLSQNTKIEHSGGKNYRFYNLTLPAYKGLFYDEKVKKFKIITICKNANSCKLYCYAKQGGYVMFPGAFRKSARIINYLMNDWEGFKNQLISEIQKAEKANAPKGIQVVIRWHDAGDMIDNEYLEMAYDIARQTPNVIHYAYTKNVNMVTSSEAPDNFTFTFSFGGKEDKFIPNIGKKYSVVVPYKYFSDLGKTEKIGKDKKFVYNNTGAIKELKNRISERYKVDKNSVITYKELMKIPYDKNAKYTLKWNVIVAAGDGDDAAMRKDVSGVFLLMH